VPTALSCAPGSGLAHPLGPPSAKAMAVLGELLSQACSTKSARCGLRDAANVKSSKGRSGRLGKTRPVSQPVSPGRPVSQGRRWRWRGDGEARQWRGTQTIIQRVVLDKGVFCCGGGAKCTPEQSTVVVDTTNQQPQVRTQLHRTRSLFSTWFGIEPNPVTVDFLHREKHIHTPSHPNTFPSRILRLRF
jgi:hypothetical protein